MEDIIKKESVMMTRIEKCMCVFMLAFVFVIGMSSIIQAQNFAELDFAEESMVDPHAAALFDDDLGAIQIEMISEADVNLQKLYQDIPDDGASSYTLGKLDVLDIFVQRHPEVSGRYVINNEGKVQYDFVGDIFVEGLTKDAIRDKFVELLSTYIVSPEVTVKISEYNSKVVYVIGEVGRPGKIFMRGDTITVHEALVQAGLPRLTASTRKGKVITPSEDGKAKQQAVDVHKLLYQGDLRENLVMLPGDTLYVPATGLTKVMRAISPVSAPIGTAAGTGRTVSGF